VRQWQQSDHGSRVAMAAEWQWQQFDNGSSVKMAAVWHWQQIVNGSSVTLAAVPHCVSLPCCLKPNWSILLFGYFNKITFFFSDFTSFMWLMQNLILINRFLRSTAASWLIMYVKGRASSTIQQPEISDLVQKQDILIELFLGFSSPSNKLLSGT